MATIEDLPKELLVEIFSHYVRSEGLMEFLTNIPRVCRYWNVLSSDSSFWRDVRARDWNFLLNVSRRGLLYNTQSIKFDDDESYSDMNLSVVLKNIRDLKSLEFFDVAVGSDAIKLVTEHCQNLEHLFLFIRRPGNATSHEWDQFFTVCGSTLKHLKLVYICSEEAKQQLVSRIAAECPLLEKLVIFLGFDVPLPIYELRSGCPNLRELEFRFCNLITAERNDSSDCGFKELEKFRATFSDFSGLDICSLLKNSVDLEQLELDYNENLVLGNISEIQSDRVKILHIDFRNSPKNLKVLVDAVWKWRRTLSVLKLWDVECDVSCVLDSLLQDNPKPQLESLTINDEFDPHLIKKLIQKCKNLIRLKIDREEYKGREEIERRFGISNEKKGTLTQFIGE